MKHILSILAACLLCGAPVAAQNNIDWGDNLELSNGFQKLIYADSLGKGYFLTRNKAGDTFVEMQPLHAEKPGFATKIYAGSKDLRLESIYHTEEGIRFILREYNKQTGVTRFLRNFVKYNGNLGLAEPEEIFAINGEKKNESSIHLHHSPSRNRMVIAYRAPESEEMKLYGFDAAYNKLYEKTALFYKNSKYGLFSASDFIVTDNGDFIYQVEKIKVTKRNGDWESAEQWVFIFRAEERQADSLTLATGLSTLGYRLDGNELTVFGTTRAPGIYFFRYDIARETILAQATQAVTAGHFITPGALDASKGKPSLPRSSIDIKRNANGYFVVMDAGMYQNSGNPYGGGSLMITMYDCQVLSISTEGKLNWIATILRDHVGATTTGQLGAYGISTSVSLRKDDFSLYNTISRVDGDGLLLLMNDDRANVPQPATEKELKAVRKSAQLSACIVRVSADGKISKTPAASSGKTAIRWHASYCYSAGNYLYAFFDSTEKAGGALFRTEE